MTDLSVEIGRYSPHAEPDKKQQTIVCSVGALNIIIGDNGSGKTTLLDVLALRKSVPKGITFRHPGYAQPTDVAYLPQQFWHIADIKVADLLKLAGGERPCDRGGSPSTLSDVLAEPKKELGQLSGGQLQILLFTLVSMQRKKIFIYDEPFGHLDAYAVTYVRTVIERQVNSGFLVILSELREENRWTVACNPVRLTVTSPRINEVRPWYIRL